MVGARNKAMLMFVSRMANMIPVAVPSDWDEDEEDRSNGCTDQHPRFAPADAGAGAVRAFADDRLHEHVEVVVPGHDEADDCRGEQENPP
jgi:hypothetical protein